MQMDGWADYLHASLYGEHVLFPTLRLTSFATFITAAALSATICLAERSLTFALTQHWAPFRAVRQSRAHSALWRAGLYALATLLRLLYMLLSMTFHVWLILVIVLSLTAGQFLIEYYEQPHDHSPTHRNAYHQPVALPTTTRYSPPRMRRARGKANKPAGLFIHPNNSNLARADAVAVELGLHRSTERVEALRTSCDSDDDDDDGGMAAWGQGRGRDTARHLLGGATTIQQTRGETRAHSRSDSQQKLFQVGDSESDG